MSFLAVAGVFLKLPRLFLKRCKWVLVRMAMHCKLSTCKSSRIPANSNVAMVVRKEQLQGSSGDGLKWRRAFMVLSVFVCLIGSLWLFPDLNHNRCSMTKEKVSTLWVEKARILQERLNVTRSQLHAMATLFEEYDQIKPSECIDRMRLEMPLGDDFNCAPEALSLYREKFQMWREWVEEKIEARDQCPVRDEYIPKKSVSTLVKERHTPPGLSEASLSNNQIKNDLQTRYLGDYRKEHCESLPICFLKISWCVFIGMMVSWKFSCFNEGLRIIPKQKQAQQELIQKQPQVQSSSKGCGKWRRKLLVVFLLAGISGSSWLFRFMNKNTILWRREMLANMCDERARMLQDQFNVSLNHVHALAILVSTFHHGKKPTAIDQETFAEYTERTAFERPLTSGVAYALKVMHSEREQFEKLHGWTIKKMETDDHSSVEDYIPEKLDPSPVEDEYAPVIFCQETVSHIVSIDMMSGKEDRENILRARKSGKGVLTSPFKLLKSNHLGVVLTFAIYNTDLPRNATPEQRIEATEGYLGASYDVPSLVEKLLHQLASKQTIVVNVYDTTNSSALISMYGPNVTDTGLLHISNLDFGDPVRRHEMHCRFKQKAPPPLTAIMASLGVLVITLLVGHIFDAAINRIAKVEGDYCEMMELKVRAEAADVAKSQFLATVSHEIRTPMNGVLGMLQMLMDTDLNANQLDYATTALESGKDLISLINEVLDQARIESGRLELEAVPFDLRSVLDNVLSLFSGKSQDKHIELAVYISDLVHEVVIGDPGRFRQIITNLVGNSVKFTEEGHVLVSVHIADEVRTPLEVKDKMLKQPIELANDGEVKSYDTLSGLPVVNRWKSWEKFETLKNGSSMDATEMINLLVTVEDTGVGIPTDAQSRIFMPFMQADSSTSRTYGGTGIGLSISKCLVDMMGGEIGFVSERGTGSVFSFTVALAKGRIDSLDKKKRHQFEQSMSELRGLKALIVDVRSVRAAVTLYHLNRLGISVDIASSLEAMCSHVSNACKTSGKMPFDMVLIDKDGWNKEISPALHCILKELRLSGKEKLSKTHLKIFLLATSSSTETAEFSSSGLVDEVIMKPLRLGMLVKCFQQAFGSGKHHHKERPSFLQSLLSGKEILVVDDNVVNRRVAAGALKKYGAKVTCVESGRAALAKLRPPHNFDACFMDLQMPEMDGFEATRQVRCIENDINKRQVHCIENDINKQTETSEACSENLRYVKHWHTPILAMTADVIQATHEKCMKCGMDGYVSKPFEEEQLYNAVMHFFESEQSSPSHET